MSWLKDQAVLITGAAGGIGRATCLAFADQGAWVLGMDRQDAWLADAQRDAEKRAGRPEGIRAVTGDVTDGKSVLAAVEALEEWRGRVDVLISAAGIQTVGTVEETSEEAWQQVLDVNLTGTWLLCKHAVPALRRAGGGVILCLASTTALHPRPNLGAYCVSKAGVAMLVRVLGREVAAEGIRVVGVCPTGVETPLLDGMIEGLKQRTGGGPRDAGLMANKPVQRWLTPQEVADSLVWLTSPAASMVSGSNIPLDFASS